MVSTINLSSARRTIMAVRAFFWLEGLAAALTHYLIRKFIVSARYIFEHQVTIPMFLRHCSPS